MTWSAQITRPDGTNPAREGATAPDYSACMSCKHGQNDFQTGNDSGGIGQVVPCSLSAVANNVGPLLTSVDVGADGHMASGTAILKCDGYELKE